MSGIENKNMYSTPRYLQSNGLAEATNKILLTALKKLLDSAKGKWVDELHGILWAYKTTARRSISISPFVITYGIKSIILTEISMPTIRIGMPDQENAKLVIKDLDTVDELRESTIVRIVSYQRRLTNSYNKRVKPGCSNWET